MAQLVIVQLGDDLIAEKGEVLVIHDNVLTIMNGKMPSIPVMVMSAEPRVEPEKTARMNVPATTRRGRVAKMARHNLADGNAGKISAYLAEHPGADTNKISSDTGVFHKSVSSVCSQLKNDGLFAAVTGAGGRMEYHLTCRGQAALNKAVKRQPGPGTGKRTGAGGGDD